MNVTGTGSMPSTAAPPPLQQSSQAAPQRSTQGAAQQTSQAAAGVDSDGDHDGSGGGQLLNALR